MDFSALSGPYAYLGPHHHLGRYFEIIRRVASLGDRDQLPRSTPGCPDARPHVTAAVARRPSTADAEARWWSMGGGGMCSRCSGDNRKHGLLLE
jgi:hypothetical protein